MNVLEPEVEAEPEVESEPVPEPEPDPERCAAMDPIQFGQCYNRHGHKGKHKFTPYADPNGPKRPRGRPRNPYVKRPWMFRIRPELSETLKEFLRIGQYSSQDAMLEHLVLHAQACEGFQPGSPDLVWTKQGEVEAVDFSEL